MGKKSPLDIEKSDFFNSKNPNPGYDLEFKNLAKTGLYLAGGAVLISAAANLLGDS